MRMILRLQYLIFCFTVVVMTANLNRGVSYDYYFSALRSKKACDNITEKLNCQMKCGEDTGMCIGNDCFCLSVSRLEDYGVKDFRHVQPILLKCKEDRQWYSNSHDYSDEPELHYERRKGDSTQDTSEYLDESLINDKPVLRHHIAHFCPNLDVARTCIRTCMKEGKPAFCGKDHVCYCGHRYSNKDRNPKGNVSNVYAEFKDLYEKYFGPNYKQEIHV